MQELSTEERSALLDQLRAEHKHISEWDVEDYGLLVFRRMRRQEALRIGERGNKARATNSASEGQLAAEECCEICLVYPRHKDVEEKKAFLSKVFDEYPMLAQDAGVAIQELSSQGYTGPKKG